MRAVFHARPRLSNLSLLTNGAYASAECGEHRPRLFLLPNVRSDLGGSQETSELIQQLRVIYNWFLMAFKPVRDNAIGPLIVTAAIVGWLLALALLFYIATQKA